MNLILYGPVLITYIIYYEEEIQKIQNLRFQTKWIFLYNCLFYKTCSFFYEEEIQKLQNLCIQTK